jgi:hypothetical protein
MGINSLHFPDDRAAGAQTVSTVDIGQPKLAIGDAVVSEINFALSTIALRAEAIPSRHRPNESRLTFA